MLVMYSYGSMEVPHEFTAEFTADIVHANCSCDCDHILEIVKAAEGDEFNLDFSN